ncbi:MAG TPA: ankyrin repeat domain-containing protein, partial [Burkholderiaceae bacterium]
MSGPSRKLLFTWLCAAAIALPMAGAHAQAASNPNLNAQLLVGARQDDIAHVERVLAQGAVPNSRNRLGKTALLLACEKGNLPLAEVMLRSGADIAMASIEGVTPLMAASYAGNAELVRR